MRQQACLDEMIWSVNEIIEDLSRYYMLHPGDLIFTGTPAGVGPVAPGDQLEGGIDGVGHIAVSMMPPGSV
jgi:fumarylpyruvate hydrolase